MLKKYGDQRFIGASPGSATGRAPQNDRAFASLSIATQSPQLLDVASYVSTGLQLRESALTVFDACLDVRPGRIDEPGQRRRVCTRFGSQLHMAHEPAGALQQARRIRQR